MTEPPDCWICPSCRRSVPNDTDACGCAFQRRPEERAPPADTMDTARSILEGYQALDIRSSGLYGKFLGSAARCTRCADDPDVPPEKKPIPLMCGTAGLDGTNAGALERVHNALEALHSLERAHHALEALRRKDGSLCFDPENKASEAQLVQFLDRQGLKGLAVGHCGWGDLTARIRGRQLADGVDLMILGADWYPLTQCSNFLLDRYTEWDNTVKGFMTLLDKNTKREDIANFFVRHRVYLGNVLLCYRTGWDKTGDRNLSWRSFVHCSEHLRRHIVAVTPRIVVTLGKNAGRSVAALLVGETHEDQVALGDLAKGAELKKVMKARYDGPPSRGIAARLGVAAGDTSGLGQRITFVPLYHPCYGNRHRYAGDYEALNALLSNRS